MIKHLSIEKKLRTSNGRATMIVSRQNKFPIQRIQLWIGKYYKELRDGPKIGPEGSLKRKQQPFVYCGSLNNLEQQINLGPINIPALAQ